MDSDSELEGVLMKSDEENVRDTLEAGRNTHYSKSKNGESRKMLDITRDKPIKVAVRVVVPVKDHPKFNFVGKLLGPKGNSLKRLQEDTMCRMAVLGRGSMKDRQKEEELRASGDPKFLHLSEELHVEISAFATPAEAHARIAYALAEVRRFLVPDYNDDIRQEQMWEMKVLSSQKNKRRDEEGCSKDTVAMEVAEKSAEKTEIELENEDDQLASKSCSKNETVPMVSPNETQTTTNGNVAQVSGIGRKRPLLVGGTRTTMTPTKRTVMSLLARARAAQSKHIPSAFQRTAQERTTTLVPILGQEFINGALNLNLI